MSNLLHQRCQALQSGAPMSDVVIHDHLAQLGGWHLNQGSIEKTYSFKNFHLCDEGRCVDLVRRLTDAPVSHR